MSDISRNVRLKRVYDPPSPEDGIRILVTRYWPRGIRRELVDEYDAKVAPSRELLREFKHEGLAWEPYTKRYLHEMESDESRRDIDRLAEIARTRTLTLMCASARMSRIATGACCVSSSFAGWATRITHPHLTAATAEPCRRSLPGARGCPPSQPLGRVGGQDDIP